MPTAAQKEVRDPPWAVWSRGSGAHFNRGGNGVAGESSDALGGNIRRPCEASVPGHSEKMLHEHREDGRLSVFYNVTKLTLGCPYKHITHVPRRMFPQARERRHHYTRG